MNEKNYKNIVQGFKGRGLWKIIDVSKQHMLDRDKKASGDRYEDMVVDGKTCHIRLVWNTTWNISSNIRK